MKIAGCGLAILLVLPAGLARAQEQSAPSDALSPAEAARRAREAKQSQPKATKTFDNDTLPKTPGGINVVGEAPGAIDEAAPGAPAAAPGSSPAAASAEAAAAKSKLQNLKADLDSLKRA